MYFPQKIVLATSLSVMKVLSRINKKLVDYMVFFLNVKSFFWFFTKCQVKIFYKNKNPPKIGFLKIYRNTKIYDCKNQNTDALSAKWNQKNLFFVQVHSEIVCW